MRQVSVGASGVDHAPADCTAKLRRHGHRRCCSSRCLRCGMTGPAALVEKVNAAAKTDLDLRSYPFDDQRLDAIFEVLGVDEAEVMLSSCARRRTPLASNLPAHPYLLGHHTLPEYVSKKTGGALVLGERTDSGSNTRAWSSGPHARNGRARRYRAAKSGSDSAIWHNMCCRTQLFHKR